MMRGWLPGALRVIAAAILLVAVSGGAASAEDAGPRWHHVDAAGDVRVDLYVFWTTSCPHCRRAVRFIQDELAPALPWLEVHLHELSEPGEAALYQRFAAALGIEAAYVPAFFYCGRAFHGYDQDDTTGQYLRESLGACRAELVAALADEPRATISLPADAPMRLPLLGELDPEAWSLPVITVALAGMDAFNPCAFFVLLFLLSLMVHAQSRARMALVGGVFVLFSGLLYFVFMAAWLNLFLLVGYLPVVTAGAGVIALVVGGLNVKDFVWLHQGVTLSIPEQAKPGLFQRMRGLIAASSLPAVLLGTVALALAANAYELLCTAGFPLVFTRILTLRDLGASSYYAYLGLYNLVYVLPLLAIVVGFVATLGARKLKEEEGRILKLLSGLMMLGLGAVLLLAPEWLNQPFTALGLIAAAVVLTALALGARRMLGTPGAKSTARW